MVTVPTKNQDGSLGESRIPMQLPHKVLDHLLTCGLEISDRKVNKFWSHMESVGDSWTLSTKQFRDACAEPVWAVGLYGDEACMQINNAPYDKVAGVFLNLPLFRPKSSRLSRYLLFAIETTKVVSAQETYYPLLTKIVESLNFATETGVQGRHFLLSEFRGDQL